MIVDVDRGRVSYDVYEVRANDLRGHGMVIDDEPAESVIERLNAYFGDHAIRAVRHPGDVDVVGPRGELEHVAIINPLRAETQVELARTDAIHLGIDPPLRESGHLEATPGVRLRGPRGEIVLDHGAILAQRHVHMNPREALRLGVHDHDVIRVHARGDREVMLGDVLVRIAPHCVLDLHVDTDEANAAGLVDNATVTFAGIERRG